MEKTDFPSPPVWAWHPDRKEHEAGYTLFRRAVECRESFPYHIIVSADNRFTFFLDGAVLGRGPLRGDLDHYFCDEYRGVLPPGKHIFAAEVSQAPGSSIRSSPAYPATMNPPPACISAHGAALRRHASLHTTTSAAKI